MFSFLGLVFILMDPWFVLQRYLIPVARTNAGIKEEQAEIQDATLSTLIKSYCRESGVRNLQKHIEKVAICYLFYLLRTKLYRRFDVRFNTSS